MIISISDLVIDVVLILFCGNENYENYLDLSYSRIGQDVRYSVNDNKLKNTGWQPSVNFDNELPKIIEYYKNNYIW